MHDKLWVLSQRLGQAHAQARGPSHHCMGGSTMQRHVANRLPCMQPRLQRVVDVWAMHGWVVAGGSSCHAIVDGVMRVCVQGKSAEQMVHDVLAPVPNASGDKELQHLNAIR